MSSFCNNRAVSQAFSKTPNDPFSTEAPRLDFTPPFSSVINKIEKRSSRPPWEKKEDLALRCAPSQPRIAGSLSLSLRPRATRLFVRKHLLLVHHPSDGDDGGGGDFGGADTDGRVALVLVAVVDIGLDVVVGRVVVGLLHAAGRLGALQDVVDFALDVLDHLAAVRFGAVASLDDVVAFVVAVLRRSRDALVTLESGHRGDGEDGRERHGDQHLRQARHFFPCFGFGSPRKTEDWLRVDGSWQR